MAVKLKHYVVICILLAVTSRPMTSDGGIGVSNRCDGTQYIDYGKAATIQCHFPEGFYRVYWYSSADVTKSSIISLEESNKYGDGYTSGEFNIHPNGSLIINRVTFHHNHTFSVALLSTKDEQPIVSRVSVIVKDVTKGCKSTQYLEYGKPGIIQCYFTDYFGVFWYNSTEVNRTPILRFQESVKTGDGYVSKEFDIFLDGSLVIMNVNLRHDHVIAVAMLKTRYDTASIENVTVVVTAFPTVLHPDISQCKNIYPCLKTFGETVDLSCSVRGSRPPIELYWLSISKIGKYEISSEKLNSTEGIRYKTYANISNLNVEQMTLITCEANDTALVLQKNESIVLLEPIKYIDASKHVHAKNMFVRKATNMSLGCTPNQSDTLFTLWRKTTNANETSAIVLSALGLQTIYSKRYRVSLDGNLTVGGINIADEGVYSCITGDGLNVQVHRYNVTVVVIPPASSPVIKECTNQLKCEIMLEDSVVISCSVQGIRPIVHLGWEIMDNTQNEVISMDTIKSSFHDNRDDTYDVSITSRFTKRDKRVERVNVVCKVNDDTSRNFLSKTFSRGFTLVFSKELPLVTSSTTDVTESSEDKKGDNHSWTTYVIITCLAVLIIGCVLWSFWKIKGKILQMITATAESQKSQNASELSSLSTESDNLIDTNADNGGDHNIRKRQFEELRNTIGLNEWIKDGLISMAKTRSGKISEGVVSNFFSRLMSENIEIMKLLKEVFQPNLKAEEDLQIKKNERLMDSVIAVSKQEEQESIMLSYRDILYAIIHSCEPNLRREIISTMSLRNSAVPLLLPEPGNPKEVACLFSDIENISKKGRNGTERYVTTYPFPSIAAVRIGELGGRSKSGILNTMLGKSQGNHNRALFYSNKEDNYSKWSNGTVESVWFIPNGNSSKEEHVLNEEMCVLNHRGSLEEDGFSDQEKFLYKFATCLLIFVSDHMIRKIDSICSETEADVIVVKLQGEITTDNLKYLERDNVTIIYNAVTDSEMHIAEKVCKSLKSVILRNKEPKTLEEHGKKLCQELSINVYYNGTIRNETFV